MTVPTGERELLPEQSVYEPSEWVERFDRAGFVVFEDELYELTDDGWRSVPELTPGLRVRCARPRRVGRALRGAAPADCRRAAAASRA